MVSNCNPVIPLLRRRVDLRDLGIIAFMLAPLWGAKMGHTSGEDQPPTFVWGQAALRVNGREQDPARGLEVSELDHKSKDHGFNSRLGKLCDN
jgi:hypothetical protein